MTAGKNFDISIQLVHPLREMANIIKCEISEMVNGIIFRYDPVPFFDHDAIHLVHAFEGTIEILEAVRIVEMRIGGKECWHHRMGQLGLFIVLLGLGRLK